MFLHFLEYVQKKEIHTQYFSRILLKTKLLLK